jgi:hypothetical protein
VLAGPAAFGVVEIALHPGGYVRFGEDAWLLVAVPRAPRGPLSLLVPALEAAPLAPGDAAVLDAAALRVGAHDITRASTCSSPVRTTLRSRAWRPALAAALASVPAAPAALAPGINALRHCDLAAAIHALAGRGEGLTPAGDDVLAGYAAWRAADSRPVALTDDARGGAARDLAAPPRAGAAPDLAPPPRAARDLAALSRARCSPLGLAYLRCAQRGEIAEPAQTVLDAIRAGDVAGARRRARALSVWGASSGAAMLWGMAAAA